MSRSVKNDSLKTEYIWAGILAAYLTSAILIAAAGLIPYGLPALGLGLLLAAGCLVMRSGSRYRQYFFIPGIIFLILSFYRTDISLQRGFIIHECLLILALWFLSAKTPEPEKYCPVRRVNPVEGLYFIGAGIGLYFVSSYINSLSMLFFTNQVSVTLEAQKDSIAAMIIVSSILPALTEEILFRGLIFGSLKGKKTKILLSSLLFALYHMNFNQMSYAFIMGIALAFFRMKRDNMLPSFLVHMMINLVSVLSVCLPGFHAFTVKFAIGGWKPFGMILRQDGRILYGAIGAGACLCLVILLLLLAGFIWIFKGEERIDEKKTDAAETAASWKTSIYFYLVSGLCLLAAILSEIVS